MGRRRDETDNDTGESIRRVERQLALDGRLDRAIAVEDLARAAVPFVLAAVFVVARTLHWIGFDGVPLVVTAVAVIVGGLLGVLYLCSRD